MCYYFGKTKCVSLATNRFSQEPEDTGTIRIVEDNPDPNPERISLSTPLTASEQHNPSE